MRAPVSTRRQTLGVFALTHEPRRYRQYEASSVNLIDLNDLGLSQELQGNELAENRFFLSSAADTESYEFVAIVPVRWNERFPLWPNLNSLQRRFLLSEKLDAASPSLANMVRDKRDLLPERMIRNHPGIETVLADVIEKFEIVVPQKSLAPMGNTFIVSQIVFRDFLKFFRDVFTYLHTRYGFVFPFTYRCERCGTDFEEGYGRYLSNRHAGYLYERVSALFFSSRPDLSWKPRQEAFRYSRLEFLYQRNVRDARVKRAQKRRAKERERLQSISGTCPTCGTRIQE